MFLMGFGGPHAGSGDRLRNGQNREISKISHVKRQQLGHREVVKEQVISAY